MKKLDKILAIASSVMFMSCVVGVSPRAVKYNEKGIPYALELPKNPTEAQVFEELQIVEDFINKKHKEFSEDQLLHNTLKFCSEVYCKSTGTKSFVFKNLELTNVFCKRASINTSDLNERFYQGVLDGEMGVCTIKQGYFHTLLKNANIECYDVSIHFLDGTASHNFVIYKPTKNSDDWYVLLCGFRIIMKDGKDTPLDKLTIGYYLNSIRKGHILDYLVIEPPILGQQSPGVDLKRRIIDVFSNARATVDRLILCYKKMFNLK